LIGRRVDYMLSSVLVQADTSSFTLSTYSYLATIGFGILALGSLAFKRNIDINFMILYGLMIIAVLASVLVFADIPETARTAVFTLFGTIAGYLAGIRTPDKADDGSGRRERN